MGYAEQYGMLKGSNKSGWYTNTEPVRKMTQREAIEILEEVSLLDDSIYQYNPQYIDALNLVIELLRQEGEIAP